MDWVRRRPLLVALVGVLLALMLLGVGGLGVTLLFRNAALRQARLAEQQARLAELQAEAAQRMAAERQAKDAAVLAAKAERLAREKAELAAMAERQAREQAAVAERQAKEVALKRFEQIEKAHETILAALFRDLDPKGDKPLAAQLSDRVNQAADQLEAEGVGDQLTVARLQIELANAQLQLGYPDRAITLYTKARKVVTDKLGRDHPDTLTSLGNLAGAYQAVGKLNLAVPLYEETLQLRKVKLGPEHPDTLASMHNLAEAYQAAGKLALALPLFEETLQLRKAKLGPDHPTTLRCMANLAMCYEETEAFAKAETLWRQVLAGYHARPGKAPSPIADARLGLGKVLLHQKKYGEAETSLREGIDLRVQLKSDAWSTFEARSLLGAALLGQKKYADAEALLLAGYEGMKQRAAQIPTTTKSRLVEAAQRLVDLYEAWDRPESAALWRKAVEAEKAKLPGKVP
jgi:Tfp pilus assembly protein PilV